MSRKINENERNELQEKLTQIGKEQNEINAKLKIIAYRERKRQYRKILSDIEKYNTKYNTNFLVELKKSQDKQKLENEGI